MRSRLGLGACEPADQMDGGAQRELRLRRAGPRPCHPCRAGAQQVPVGGSALVKALDKIVDKGKKIAAHMMEAAEVDIEFKDGAFSVAGTDKNLPFGAIAFSAYVPHNYPLETLEPGLDET